MLIMTFYKVNLVIFLILLTINTDIDNLKEYTVDSIFLFLFKLIQVCFKHVKN